MKRKTMLLLAVAMVMLLPSQVRAQDSPGQSVDLTTRTARAAQDDGLRKIKNQPSWGLDVKAARNHAAAVQTATADMKRDAVIKAKAQSAMAVSKVKDKKETAIKRLAHHPAVSPSLQRMKAPRRAGEVCDDYGVIIKPADGLRKVYNRSGQALNYDPDGDSWLLTEQSGQVDVVLCDNGDVYIKDIISTYRNSAWVKGTYSGNTITIPTGQLLNYEPTYGVPYAVYWGKKDGRDYFRNDERTAITFTIDGRLVRRQATSLDGLKGIYLIGGKKVYVK